MEISFATLDSCSTVEGLVVVIDVVRAFTTAAYAFSAGASEILLTGTVEEALALRAAHPGARVMGEVGGLPPPGFDYGNSPREVLAADLAGIRLVQRTGAGTQGVVRSRRASAMLAASFVCAGATARYIRQLSPDRVTFIVTGIQADVDGDEDQACAEYLAALLEEDRFDGSSPPQSGATRQVSAAPYLDRVRAAIEHIGRARPALRAMLAADEPYCTDLDRFPFAMRVERREELLVMAPVRPG